MRTFFRAVLSVLSLIVFAPTAQASGITMYTYSGNTFTSGTGDYTTSDLLTGYFAYADGFGPVALLTGCDTTCAAGHDGLIGWAFDDGHQRLTEDNSTIGRMVWFEYPGAYPDGVAWMLGLSGALGTIYTTSSIGDYGDYVQSASGTGSLSTYCFHGLCSLPGTWTVTHTGQVPEPAPLLLLVSGFGGLALFRRWHPARR